MRDPLKRRQSQRDANRRWRSKLRGSQTRVVNLIVDIETMQRADAVANALDLSVRNRRELFATTMLILHGLTALGFPIKHFAAVAQEESL